jgi:hypothetical protein
MLILRVTAILEFLRIIIWIFIKTLWIENKHSKYLKPDLILCTRYSKNIKSQVRLTQTIKIKLFTLTPEKASCKHIKILKYIKKFIPTANHEKFNRKKNKKPFRKILYFNKKDFCIQLFGSPIFKNWMLFISTLLWSFSTFFIRMVCEN